MHTMTTSRKTYLGDGAYAEFDGYGIVLTTENGISVTNRIVLEPDVYRSLAKFVDALKENADTHLTLGDCVSCDGYVLSPSEAPYCPSCYRERASQ